MQSGNHLSAPSRPFPEDSVQSLVGNWWTIAEDREVRRGQLLWSPVPFVGWLPYRLVPESRVSPTDHTRALFRLEEQRFRERGSGSKLPIAALPQNPGESYSVYRSKVRPVLVIGIADVEVERALTRGAAKWQSIRTYLVAPYFGADASRQRGGWKPELVRHIRQCRYPQFLWDRLPTGSDSILRLDQLQPIGRHHEAYEYTPHRLSAEGIEVLDEWLRWYIFDDLDPEGILQMVREDLPRLAC